MVKKLIEIVGGTYKLFKRGEWVHKLSGTWVKSEWSTRIISKEMQPSNDGNSFKLRASDKTLLMGK